MFARRLPRLFARRSRRLIAAAAALAYLASVLGFPLPVPAARDVSTPFPCQDHHCGCASAEQCWHNCCCFSAEERLAWAQKHNVTLSRDIETALADEAHEHKSPRSCCTHHDESPGCDEHHAGGRGDDAQDNQKTSPRAKVRWVHGFQAQKCQGLSLVWITTGITVPVHAAPAWEFDWVACGQVCLASDLYLSWHAATPERPPSA